MVENKISITGSDISSLEGFSLLWRWTESKYVVLSDEELSEIHQLNPSAARNVDSLASSFIHDSSYRPSPDLFEQCVECDTSGDPKDGRVWLEYVSRSFDLSVPVIVSWSPELAVTTKLWLFVKYWDDFCYPMSDDTTIFPLDVNWVIQYWHEEVLYFASAKS